MLKMRKSRQHLTEMVTILRGRFFDGIALKISTALSALAVAASVLTPGCALGQEVHVRLNGSELSLGAQARIENGVTLVPMRPIFETLGMKVAWNGVHSTAVAVKNGKSVVVRVGNPVVTVNGQDVDAGAAALLENGATLVPLRVIGEALNIGVNWNAGANTVELTDEDKPKDEGWKENTGNIDLSAMTVNGNGLSVSGKTVEITQGGDFTVSGSNDDAMIHVNTDSRVKLRLDGVRLTNASGPAIFFENSDKGFITINKGTENFLADGAEYNVDAKATLFSNDDLEIKGGGALTVAANHNHAIASDDEIKIEEGVINITAVGDGIHANDEVTVTGGSITINAVGDGVQSEGFVNIEGGDIDITTTGEIAQDQNDPFENFGFGGGRGGRGRLQPPPVQGSDTRPVMPTDGEPFDPNAAGPDGMNTEPPAERPAGDYGPIPMGDRPPEMPPEGISAGETASSDADENSGSSSKGIKAETNLIVSGGSVKVDSTDHCVHSAGIVFIDGGSLTLSSQFKKGISAHSGVVIENGGIDVQKSIEGIESKALFFINGGSISVNSSDDGLNAGGTGGVDARNTIEHNLCINGGDIYINSQGDGVDANGTIYFAGGEVHVDGPTNNGNGALDSGANVIASGSALVAVGSSAMAEYPRGEACTQPSVIYTAPEPLEAGSEISLVNSNGETILTHTAAKTFQNAVFSSPMLEIGLTVSVVIDGKAVETFEIESMTQSAGAALGGRNGFGGRAGGGFGGRVQR